MSKSILITVDALRADHLAQYGYHRDTMPVLDRLSEEGTRFQSAYTNGTNSGESIPSFLTSRYLGSEHIEDGPTIASPLQDEGVLTAGFHSNPLFAGMCNRPPGFEDYEDYGVADSDRSDPSDSLSRRAYKTFVDLVRPIVGDTSFVRKIRNTIIPLQLVHSFTYYVSAEEITDDLLEWLQTHADEDFFLWVHYMDPHRPYGIDLDDPEYSEGPVDKESIKDLMTSAGLTPEKVTEEERKQIIDLYDSDLRYTSNQLERLFDGIENLGIWNDTNVLLTADHGEEFGEHGHFFHRNRPYEELIHVPLFAKTDKGHDVVESKQRQLIDVAPTVCSLHDVESPSEFLGKNLFDKTGHVPISTGSFSDDDRVVGVREPEWKYINGGEYGQELYDLADDPEETTNVVAGNPTVVDHLRSHIPDYLLSSSEAEVLEPEDEEVEERLRGLGYLE